jgi:hypothetical protein
LLRKSEEKYRKEDNTKVDLKRRDGCELHLSGSVTGFRNGNEPPGSIDYGEFLD